MPPHRKINEVVRQQVRQRTSSLCEYCHASEQWQYVQFTVDHVIPTAQGGADTIGNLALACFHCNRRKADKTTAIDPQFDAQVLLFNPRQDIWKEHFIWSADVLSIVGITPAGRATVVALGLNREWVINIRAADRSIGRHPPIGDPIQPAD